MDLKIQKHLQWCEDEVGKKEKDEKEKILKQKGETKNFAAGAMAKL